MQGLIPPQESKVGELTIHLWRLLGPQEHGLASLGQKWGLKPLRVPATWRMAGNSRVGRPWSVDFKISRLVAGLDVLGVKAEMGAGME